MLSDIRQESKIIIVDFGRNVWRKKDLFYENMHGFPLFSAYGFCVWHTKKKCMIIENMMLDFIIHTL